MGMATKTLLTLEEFERLPDDGALHELNEGELVTVVRPRHQHAEVAYKLLVELIKVCGTGRVYPDAAFVLSEDPPTLRAPDLAFVPADRVADTQEDDWMRGAPELAVEVVSPSESAQDLQQKVEQYLAAGAKLVWVVYPKTHKVHVHKPDSNPIVLADDDLLEAPDLFPGWSLKVSRLFSPASGTAQ